MNVADLVRVIEQIAPPHFAAEWDRVGLLVGDRERPLKGPVLLTIDLTEKVLAEAVALKAGAIIAYHPPIWEPLRRVTADTPRQRIILRAVEAGIAVYSPHTALDAVPGGIADWLAEGLSGSTQEGRVQGDCRALTPHARLAETQQVKIVTFVPPKDLEPVRNALASGGAGIIGDYTLCTFVTIGEGTFLPGPASSPAVGEPGRIENVPEGRLEMVCARAALPIALETMRRLHPYEQPAIDVYPLEPQPLRAAGPGRRLVLDRPATPTELARRLKPIIGGGTVGVALAGDDTPITHVGICPGSGASLARRAREEQCSAYVTGEMSHHDVLATLHAGMSVILAGHTPTERGYLTRLARKISALAPSLRVQVSSADRDPLMPV